MKFYENYNDALLLALLKKSDDLAFTTIYNRYWNRLLFVAGVKFRDLAIAEEMVQDVFLDLWNRRSELDVTGSLEAYLAVSMKYKVINAQAKLKRALDFKLYAAEHQSVQDNSTVDWLNFHELQEKLTQLVASLPEKCRITYQLSREQGLSQKEIAYQLHVSEKAVEANLSRAVKSLRRAVASILSSLFSILP